MSKGEIYWAFFGPHLSCLVLCDLVLGVLFTVFALAISATSFRDVDLRRNKVSLLLSTSAH